MSCNICAKLDWSLTIVNSKVPYLVLTPVGIFELLLDHKNIETKIYQGQIRKKRHQFQILILNLISISNQVVQT